MRKIAEKNGVLFFQWREFYIISPVAGQKCVNAVRRILYGEVDPENPELPRFGAVNEFASKGDLEAAEAWWRRMKS